MNVLEQMQTESKLASFFKKQSVLTAQEAPKLNFDTKPSQTEKVRPRGSSREGTKPNYYIYNDVTQEVIELERQCSSSQAHQACTYVASLTEDKNALSLWAVISLLEPVQQIRFRRSRSFSNDSFEVDENHPLKLALQKAGYNFTKPAKLKPARQPQPPKIALKVLGVQ